MSEQDDEANAELVSAVERHIGHMGWKHADLMLTDILVVAVSRGFDHMGGKSRTVTIVPTDSAVPLLLGMARHAEMRFEKLVAESFVGEENQ